MVHSLLKSLVLYFAFAVSGVVLGAPAHQHQTEPHARRIANREDSQLLPHPRAAAPLANVDSQRSPEESYAVRKRVTNAMRFAEGLPPLAPRKLYQGSRVGSAHNARSSPMPIPIPAILVYGSSGRSGNPLGYVSQGFNFFYNQYYVTTDCREAMVNAQLFEGDLTNPAKPNGYSNAGLVAVGYGQTFKSGYEYAYLAGTAATPSGSPPVTSKSHSPFDDQELPMESNVWSLGADNELILSWINPNGDAVQMEIGYDLTGFAGILTTANGKLSEFRSNFGYKESNYPNVRLFVTDKFTCSSPLPRSI